MYSCNAAKREHPPPTSLYKREVLFRDGQDNSGEVLDSNDLERERGITILSKNGVI